MEINDDALRAAGAEIDGFHALARRARTAGVVVLDDADTSAFREVMDNDFDTPNGVAVIHGWRGAANTAIDDGRLDDAAVALAQVRVALSVLGITLIDGSADEGDDEIDALVAARTTARADKNFAESDRLRDELAARGIVIEDTAQGTIWRRG